MAVSLKPEVLEIGGIHVTNSFLTAVVIAALLILFLAIYTRKITVKPHSRFQLLMESMVTALHGLAESIMGKASAKIFFPFIFTFFILIITSNYFGLLPFSGSVGFTHHAEKDGMPILVVRGEGEETSHGEASNVEFTKKETIHAPFFRAPSADLNFTIAIAIISFGLIQYAGLKFLGVSHLGKFFDYRVAIGKGWKIILTPVMFLINFLWKTLELILEVAKIISFSFRLFGNIFAGEVLLLVMTTLTYGLATLPFLGLELFVGFIQAIVFCFLTMVFIKVGSEAHH